ncbi:MAG: CIA30 family protein [Pseudoxanthomonas sp.]
MNIPRLRPLLRFTALATALLLPLASGAAADQPTAIVNAMVFDATGTTPYRGTLVMQDGRIVAVGPQVKAPKGAKVIDAKGQALLPGLFDLHTHWTPSSTPAFTPQIATAYLATGVTTVNDFHQSPESFEPRRRWLRQLATPHVNLTARISTPLGHGADWADENTTRWVNTPESARRAVDEVMPYEPDVIKAFSDGWRYGMAPDNTSMDVETLSALVDQAHKYKRKVLTHTVTVERGAIAARAKVDVIAHSLQDKPIDAQTVQLIKQNGTFYAPTLAVYEPVKPGQAAPYPLDDPRMKARLQKFDYALQNVKTLFDAGVPVAVGTDAGMFPHRGATEHEFELLVRAGLTPTQALIAGTATSAKAIALDDDRGTLQAGKRADVILVKGAPWNDIADLRKVERVFVDGQLAYGPGAVAPKANSIEAMPAIQVAALVDDFDAGNGRTRLDTLRVDEADGGHDRTVQTTTTVPHEGNGNALMVAAELSTKADAFASAILPLSRGQVEPADLRRYKGLRFQIRGEVSDVTLVLRTPGATRWQHDVQVAREWTTIEVPFSQLAAFKPGRGDAAAEPVNTKWQGNDLVSAAFAGHGKPGQKIWFQVDNVSFY